MLVATGLLLGAVSIYSPIAQAGDPAYTIDCSADTDLTTDNEDTSWVIYTEPVEVLTTNCAYSCAAGGTDQNASCGSAWYDNYSDRTFNVTGTGWINAYDPGFYGQILYFGVSAEAIGFSADPGVNSITFRWNEIDDAIEYTVEPTDVFSPDSVAQSNRLGYGECRGAKGETSCTISNIKPGESHSYAIAVTYNWGGYQNAVATEVEAALAPTTTTAETLADTGGKSESKLVVALLLIALGIAASVVVRRRVAK